MASVGVMLSVAVTSLAIYLGIQEHVYLPGHVGAVLTSEVNHLRVCTLSMHQENSTTSTLVVTSWYTQCSHSTAAE
jgi:hypothetical protein